MPLVDIIVAVVVDECHGLLARRRVVEAKVHVEHLQRRVVLRDQVIGVPALVVALRLVALRTVLDVVVPLHLDRCPGRRRVVDALLLIADVRQEVTLRARRVVNGLRAVRLARKVAQELVVGGIIAQDLALLALLVGRLRVAGVLEVHEVRALDALLDALRKGSVVALKLVDAAVRRIEVADWEQDDLLEGLCLYLRILIHPDIARRLRRHERQRSRHQAAEHQAAPYPSLTNHSRSSNPLTWPA